MGQIPLEALTRPFSSDQVKQREGRGGKMLDYLETHAVITRLNEAFAGAWSFEVIDYKILDHEVVAHGKLTASGQTKTQFGGADIARQKGGEKPISISDDLKSAGSDALKKCATLFGIGLELYYKDGPPPQQQRQQNRQQAKSGPQSTNAPAAGTQPPPPSEAPTDEQKREFAVLIDWAVKTGRMPENKASELTNWSNSPEASQAEIQKRIEGWRRTKKNAGE